jgi:hypothetical protein
MLFACSGIPLPPGRSKLELTRYVTSARLAVEYECKRYRDDKLKVGVTASYFFLPSRFVHSSQFGHSVLMCCFYHYRLMCAFRMIEKRVGS